jgi:hypothetical protein
MAAGKYDFVIEQGATFSRAIDVSDVITSLVGFTARMQVRPSVTSSTTYLSLTDTSGLLIDTSLSTITISLSAATTLAQTWTTGVYDLELVSSSSDVTRLLEGTVTISPEVTR